jgi:cyanophycin synthetase
MKITESRRLTGPNLQSDKAGAITEVEFANSDEAETLGQKWCQEVKSLGKQASLELGEPVIRSFRGGAAWFVPAPIDSLYTAVTLNEWVVTQLIEGNPQTRDEGVKLIIKQRAQERDDNLLALQKRAEDKSIPFLWDDDYVSLGYGRFSSTWERAQAPRPEDVDWDRHRSIPIVLITGTNGKTTTSRLLARIATCAGLCAGSSSTDGLCVKEVVVDAGDWTGPGAARQLLRRKDVDLAILETARGGILRRGIGVESCESAIVTNVSSDHLGDYGVLTVSQMADTKALVYGRVKPTHSQVINVDDPEVMRQWPRYPGKSTLMSVKGATTQIQRHCESGGDAVYLDGSLIVLRNGTQGTTLCPVEDIPLSFDGSALYNVANVLGAIALAQSIGLAKEAILEGITSFGRHWDDNPGRGQFTEVKGVKIFLDFGHNPEGACGVLEVVDHLRGTGDKRGRLSVSVGQAGDRSDQDIRQLGDVVAQSQPERIFLRALRRYARGRAEGEITGIFRERFTVHGISPSSISEVDNEIEALEKGLAWAQPGDVLVHLVHLERDAVADFLRNLGASV